MTMCHPSHLAFAALLLLVACKGPKTTMVPLGAERFAEREGDWPIAVFESADEVPRQFVKVGRVTGHMGSRKHPRVSQLGQVIDAMMIEARRLGADALIVNPETGRGGREYTSEMLVDDLAEGDRLQTSRSRKADYRYTRTHVATAIRYID